MVRCVQTLYEGAVVRVQVYGRLRDLVLMERGLRQGCPLSQLLFACVQNPFYGLVDKVMNRQGMRGEVAGGYCGVCG